MQGGQIHIGEGYYKDGGCELHLSCLNCPEIECIDGEKDSARVMKRDLRRLGAVVSWLRRGGYDVIDGKLPFPEALARIKQRMIKLNQEKGLPTEHLL